MGHSLELNEENKTNILTLFQLDPYQQFINTHVKLLTTMVEPSLDIGQPVSFLINIGQTKPHSCLYDLGAGPSCINPRFIKKFGAKVFAEREYATPIKIQVGNSQRIEVTKSIFLEVRHEDKVSAAWFLVVPSLPMNLLMGRATIDRLKMDYIDGRVIWDGITLPDADTTVSINSFTKENVLPSQPRPVTDVVRPARRVEIKSRCVKAIKIRTDKPIWGKQAYVNPTVRPHGNLLLMPGLVDFDEKTGFAEVLVFNPDNKKKSLPMKDKLGELYYITERDAQETELMELTQRSIFPPENESHKLDEINDKEKQFLKEIVVNAQQIKDSSGEFKEKLVQNVLHMAKSNDDDLNVTKVLNLSEQQISKIINHSSNEDFSEFLEDDIQSVMNCLTMAKMATHGEPPPEREKRRQIYNAFAMSESNLSVSQKDKILDLLVEFDSIWDLGDKPNIEHTDTVEVSIPTGDHPPIKVPYRPTDPVEDIIIWKHISEMAKRGVIRESKSPWASPILLADKKNGKVRFCIDYRRLNKITTQDAYPLPKMQDILRVLDNASYFSTIDLTDAFWSIKVRDEDIEKTAFSCRHGLWEFVSMPFGLTNAPATQQRFIEAVLNGLLWTCCFAYIDDILCFSKTFEQHVIDLRKIFERLRQHKLKIQPPKCTFCHPSFEILGFVATKDGLKPSPKKVEALQMYPYPRTVKETQSFLGITSWMRRFIPNCSNRTVNLRLCAKQQPKNFTLSDEAKKEVDLIKKLITSDTCMAHPDLEKQFFIHVDASGVGLGAILTQLDDDNKHRVVEYASCALNRAQSRQSNTVREALGVMWALTHFKYYIRHIRPIVFTDCSCLTSLAKDQPNGTPKVAALRSWVARLLYFQPKLVHRPGKMMAIPDALSRHYISYLPEDNDDSNLPASEILG